MIFFMWHIITRNPPTPSWVGTTTIKLWFCGKYCTVILKKIKVTPLHLKCLLLSVALVCSLFYNERLSSGNGLNNIYVCNINSNRRHNQSNWLIQTKCSLMKRWSEFSCSLHLHELGCQKRRKIISEQWGLHPKNIFFSHLRNLFPAMLIQWTIARGVAMKQTLPASEAGKGPILQTF